MWDGRISFVPHLSPSLAVPYTQNVMTADLRPVDVRLFSDSGKTCKDALLLTFKFSVVLLERK